MNANQLNSLFHREKLQVRLVAGKGYYYWIGRDGHCLEAESVYVHRAQQLPADRWLELAREAATSLQSQEQPR